MLPVTKVRHNPIRQSTADTQCGILFCLQRRTIRQYSHTRQECSIEYKITIVYSKTSKEKALAPLHRKSKIDYSPIPTRTVPRIPT